MKRVMTFSENLKFYRTTQGLTQKQLKTKNKSKNKKVFPFTLALFLLIGF